jgi:hypothetical protein
MRMDVSRIDGRKQVRKRFGRHECAKVTELRSRQASSRQIPANCLHAHPTSRRVGLNTASIQETELP